MRHLFLVVASCVLSTADSQYASDHAIVDELAWREAHSHAPMLRASAVPAYGYDIDHLRLEWDLDPAQNAIQGVVTMYFTTTTDLDQLMLEAGQGLVIDQVARQGLPLGFTHDPSDALTVDLPNTALSGTRDSLSITYHGTPAGTGFGSFQLSDHNGVPVLWTLSEPYGSKDWWPCKQDLNDKSDSIDVWVTVPVGNRVACNGVLAGETALPGGTHTRFHWRHRHPIAFYLIGVAVTDYVVLNDTIIIGTDTVDMITYAYPEDAFIAELNAGDVADQMPLFSALFGAYPFADEKYGHAQFGWGGGMEHQTMSFMGYFHYELAAHELAHQWFGDKVTCGSWQDLWLNEGFATYLTGLCYNYLAPQYWHGWLQSRVNSITSEPGGSVFVSDTLDLGRLFSGRLTYNKGAYVLHMLRWVCGDTAFYAGLKNYLMDPDLAYGSARTLDLQTHLEATSGLALNEFFTDWYYGEGFPTYSLVWTQNANGTVTAQLGQNTSHSSVGFFEMPVPIRFRNGMQDSTMILQHSQNNQSFTFHLPFIADSAHVDPELWILSGQNVVLHVPSAAYGTGEVVVFPNPASGQAQVYVGQRIQGEVRMRIMETTGRIVADRTEQVVARMVPLELSLLAPGTYIVELANSSQALRTRVVRQ